MNYHKTVDLDGIPIDEGIATLILALWDRGFGTKFCCEGLVPVGAELTDAYISFANGEDRVPALVQHIVRIDPSIHDQIKLTYNGFRGYGNDCWVIRFKPVLMGTMLDIVTALPKGWNRERRAA